MLSRRLQQAGQGLPAPGQAPHCDAPAPARATRATLRARTLLLSDGAPVQLWGAARRSHTLRPSQDLRLRTANQPFRLCARLAVAYPILMYMRCAARRISILIKDKLSYIHMNIGR